MIKIGMTHTRHFWLLSTGLLLASCINDTYVDGIEDPAEGIGMKMTIRTRASGGDEFENSIDIEGGDYRVYIFTNEAAEQRDNTLIAEFDPASVVPVNGAGYRTYIISGKVGWDIAGHSGFKVVFIANWGRYPKVTEGVTTIDDIVEGDSATFAMPGGSMPSANMRMPFYGVREYSDINWNSGSTQTLNGDITLLRAVAKVEVILESGADVASIDTVTVENCNPEGYCAPGGVYAKDDYDRDGTDGGKFFTALHLVGDRNSDAQVTLPCTMTTNADGEEAWVGYMAEHRNDGADYSTVSVTIDGTPYTVYFGNYRDGTCTAYADGGDTSDRLDIHRNCLYRFRISMGGKTIRVKAEKWEHCFDNAYEFGGAEGATTN